MPHITSVNIACGGHAGSEAAMRATLEQPLKWKLAAGAHPGYPDRENFGRLEMDLPAEAIADPVARQVAALGEQAARAGARLSHVKAHGALSNQAARDRAIARAVAKGVARVSRDAILAGLAGSAMLEVFREAGFRAAAEAFADRRYERDGSLRPRGLPGAVLEDPEEAARQALRIAERGAAATLDGEEVRVEAETLCVHGDTPGSARIAAAVARVLRGRGIVPRALASQ
ncbi:MAG: LamB/YcsF family protein [Bryobacterales bacterium]|nr:LamB/YcsF family protein [Bryobacterales bacterium]